MTHPSSAYISNFQSPSPITRTLVVVVDCEKYATIFREIYRRLVEISINRKGFVAELCEDDFVLVAKYFLKSRLDHCCVRKLGYVPDNHFINIFERVYSMPKSLAEIVNNIGAVLVADGTVLMVPVAPISKSVPLRDVCSKKIWKAYNSWMRWVNDNMMESEQLSTLPTGSAFWTLLVSNLRGETSFERNEESVIIRSFHKNWTGRDAMVAAIVQISPEYEKVGWTNDIRFEAPIIHNLRIVRESFFTIGKI